jgi:lipopolysaccharide export system protein LptA
MIVNRKNKVFNKIICIIILLYSGNALALKGDSDKPIKVDADHATLDQKKMDSVFNGNVVITRGSLIIHANKGTASQDKNGDRILDLYGSPVVFQQISDDGVMVTGQCDHFNYDTKTSLAILMDRARVKKGKSIIIGDKLTYNTKTEVYSAVSDLANGVTRKSQGRVTVILDQADMKDKSSTSAPKKHK